jgi:tetratricopeptide (TPR) repeat protein
MTENYEPIAWSEELIEPAQAVDHPRLGALYTLPAYCYLAGRLEEAVRYSDAGQAAIAASPGEVLFGFESWLGGVYNFTGQAERSVEWSRFLLARGPDPSANIRAGLVAGLMMTGSHAEAITVAKDLIDAADAIANPQTLSFVLLIYGIACIDADPLSARDAMRRGLAIAQDSGNRYNETHLANSLGRLEARHGDPLAALDYLALAIRNYHDSGNSTIMRVPLAVLAAFLDRLGHEEAAAIIAGYAFSPITKAWIPEVNTSIARLRDVLGDQTYESLTRKGKTMPTTAMANYAYDQIDRARTALNAASK